ncbi:MAG TPA: GNAT family N-acetyltransferase [Alphaproteobacteria bacterium]|nr:GNAT family N-acetyltransferase [Alphaproteobacteria bacterium]
MIIRDAKLSDYKSLCQIFALCNQLHCNLRPDYYREVNPIISRKDFILAVIAQNFESGRNRVTLKLAESEGSIVGAAFAVSVSRRPLGWSIHTKEACIDNIVVLPRYRRQGVGRSLLDAVQDWAKASGHEYLFGKIVDSNTESKAFFSDAGLRTCS